MTQFKTFASVAFVLLSSAAFAQAPCSLVNTSSGGYTLECPPAPAEPHEKLTHALAIAGVALEFADAWSTADLIGRGRAHEANPVLAGTLLRDGPIAAGALKGAIIGASTLAIVKWHARPEAKWRRLAYFVLAEEISFSAVALVQQQRLRVSP